MLEGKEILNHVLKTLSHTSVFIKIKQSLEEFLVIAGGHWIGTTMPAYKNAVSASTSFNDNVQQDLS